jgi:hypothetical protein
MEEEQSSRRRSGPGQDVVEAMARASQRMALIAADPMRVCSFVVLFLFLRLCSIGEHCPSSSGCARFQA